MWALTRLEILVLRQAQDEDFVRTEANSRPHPELVEGRGRSPQRVHIQCEFSLFLWLMPGRFCEPFWAVRARFCSSAL
ncbi:hypothetical protein EIB18_04260 [Caulobacter vibrioides]|nr:hypothetical protein CA608_20125 [Caulobacter vibrioides]AZH12003.1 hypothetical protein EIB18_04260 [Caulobacter vibrioides]PLR15417.1 hypothetical protein CVUC_02770 [Caulobacter vibrioides]